VTVFSNFDGMVASGSNYVQARTTIAVLMKHPASALVAVVRAEEVVAQFDAWSQSSAETVNRRLPVYPACREAGRSLPPRRGTTSPRRNALSSSAATTYKPRPDFVCSLVFHLLIAIDVLVILAWAWSTVRIWTGVGSLPRAALRVSRRRLTGSTASTCSPYRCARSH
jgi:hypothetical protein